MYTTEIHLNPELVIHKEADEKLIQSAKIHLRAFYRADRLTLE